MVAKPAKKTAKTKKNYRKRYNKSNSLPYQMTAPAPFKRVMFAKLPYTESLTNMNSGTLGAFGTENVYRIGSIFDPYFGTGGHYPIGRNIFNQIYGKYKVYGVTVELTWSDAGGDGGVCGAMISSSQDTTTLQGMAIETAKEKPNVFLKYVNASGSQLARYKQYFDIGKIEGLTKSQFKNDIQQFASSMGTDPSLTPYLRLSVANIQQTSGVKVHCDVKLTYHVQFWNPITLPKST